MADWQPTMLRYKTARLLDGLRAIRRSRMFP
jgi:hypothetical protein